MKMWWSQAKANPCTLLSQPILISFCTIVKVKRHFHFHLLHLNHFTPCIIIYWCEEVNWRVKFWRPSPLLVSVCTVCRYEKVIVFVTCRRTKCHVKYSIRHIISNMLSQLMQIILLSYQRQRVLTVFKIFVSKPHAHARDNFCVLYVFVWVDESVVVSAVAVIRFRIICSKL